MKKDGISRREFLRMGLLATAGGVLSACGAGGGETVARGTVATQPPPAILASPLPPPDATATATRPPGEASVEQFLSLSAILTGMTALDPTVGNAYLAALRERDFAISLSQFWDRVDGAESLEDLDAAGVFEDEAARTIIDAINTYWYTGVVGQEDSTRVVTYVDALAWKSLDFTVPHTVCAHPRFWQTDPRNRT